MNSIAASERAESAESEPSRRSPFPVYPGGSGSLSFRRVIADLTEYWSHGRALERIAYSVGVVLFISGLFHLGVHLVDGGPWQGPVSFRKAFSFGTSFGLTLITLAWVQTHLRIGKVIRSVLLGGFILVSITEVFAATVQPWRGQPSHFNQNGGTFNSLLADLMTAGAVAIVVIVVTYSGYALRRMQASRLMSVAIRSGFGVLWGALIFGVIMSTVVATFLADGDAAAAYTAGEGYKPSHAATMHAILIFPAMAWVLERTALPERTRMRWLVGGIGLYVLGALVFILVSLGMLG